MRFVRWLKKIVREEIEDNKAELREVRESYRELRKAWREFKNLNRGR